MPGIHVLSPHLANQIAAGEVVERPGSIVKELVENAVDAHASAVTIEIVNGGIDQVVVADNGTGIPDEDCETAFLRHATSKIRSSDDLMHIGTLGFRGEALASIAAVSRVTMSTRTADDELGALVRYEGGALREHRRTGGPVGTRIEVNNLFYNVPARLKFLKSVRSESGAVGDYAARLILSLPNIAFHFMSNGRTVYQSTGDGSLINALVAVYGVEIVPQLCPVTFDDGYLRIDGFVGTPELSRPNRMGQSFFLNGRIIRSNALSAALARAFDTRLMTGRYPFAVLTMQIALAEVDVNVHPAKLEVRFVDEGRITRSVCVACSEALVHSYVPDVRLERLDKRAETSGVTMRDMPAPRGVDLRGSLNDHAYSVRESSAAAIPCGKAQPGPLPAAMPEFRPEQGLQSSLFDRQADGEAPLSEPCSMIGVAFQTYWFVQRGDAVYCIDQHAAHERLLYDALQNRQTTVVSQALLMPEEMPLAPEDFALYCDHRNELEQFGYVFADVQGRENRVTLAAVPQLNGVALKSAFLLDVLHGRDISRAKLMQTACKHAVKAGEPIGREELNALLGALAENEALLTCPHGRPVAVRITRLELEKMFKRVL